MPEQTVATTPTLRLSPAASTYVWLATVPLTWGFNFVALRILYTRFDFTVTGLLAARYLLMVPLLALLLLLTERDRGIRREHWLYLGIFTLVTVALYQYLFAKAIELTSAAEAALLISSAPIFAFLITTVLGWEKPTRTAVLGVLMGFAGISLVIFGGGSAVNIPETHILGDLVMIAAAVLWAAYAIFCKPLLTHYSPLKLTAWMHTLGALIIVPVGWQPMLQVDWAHLAPLAWVCVLYFAWLAGVYGFVVWYRGVSLLGPARTILFQYLVPPVALVVGLFVLGEIPSVLQFAGVAVTLGGVRLASGLKRDS